MQKGVSLSQEALFSPDDSVKQLFSLGIRCCPILNAVLDNHSTLLEVLLEAAHADGPRRDTCRVCETGSAFRRILAVLLSLFQAETIEILMKHLETASIRESGKHEAINLDRVEVWVGAELLPLQNVPFNSVAVAAMDLPECFFRAMILGVKYKESLHKLLQFFLQATHELPEKRAYSMLSTAVKASSLEGVNTLLKDVQDRGQSAL